MDRSSQADFDSSTTPVAGPAVRGRLERWIDDHPSLDAATDRFGWVGEEPVEPEPDIDADAGRGIETGPDIPTGRPRWDRLGPPPDIDLTPPDGSTARAGFDLLHITGDASIEPGPERAVYIGRRFRSVNPDRFLAISVVADGPGGDPDRLTRDLLDGTGGRVVLEHFERTEPEPESGAESDSKLHDGRPWFTIVVRCLR